MPPPQFSVALFVLSLGYHRLRVCKGKVMQMNVGKCEPFQEFQNPLFYERRALILCSYSFWLLLILEFEYALAFRVLSKNILSSVHHFVLFCHCYVIASTSTLSNLNRHSVHEFRSKSIVYLIERFWVLWIVNVVVWAMNDYVVSQCTIVYFVKVSTIFSTLVNVCQIWLCSTSQSVKQNQRKY